MKKNWIFFLNDYIRFGRLDIASEEHGKSFLEFEWGIVISSSAANYVWDYTLSGSPAACE